LEKFRRNEVPLLVCTDLASRGLDIPDVKQVGPYEW
jgi:superfamily II DNA/RNA helicase